MRGKDCRFRTGGTLAYQKAIAGPPCADRHGPACATSRNTPKGLGNPAPLRYRTGFAAIAQLVEHVIRNDGVGGSIPSCGTKSQRVLPAQIKAGRVQGLLAVMSIGGFAAWRIPPSAWKALPSKPLLPAPNAHWPRPSCAEVRTVRPDSSADRPGCSWRLIAKAPPKSWHGFRDWRGP